MGSKKYELRSDQRDHIIKTLYGSKSIPPCFGQMHVRDPYSIEARNFDAPQEYETVKEEFQNKVKETLEQAYKCTTCHLFDKCAELSKIMIKRQESLGGNSDGRDSSGDARSGQSEDC